PASGPAPCAQPRWRRAGRVAARPLPRDRGRGARSARVPRQGPARRADARGRRRRHRLPHRPARRRRPAARACRVVEAHGVTTRRIESAGRAVGDGAPPFVIAELGVNPDGQADRARALVAAAADAGADAIKTQWFRADLLMSGASALARYQADAGERDPREMLRRLELHDDAMRAIVARARARGVLAIVTIFSVELTPNATALGWDAYKFASPDVINLPLLGAV